MSDAPPFDPKKPFTRGVAAAPAFDPAKPSQSGRAAMLPQRDAPAEPSWASAVWQGILRGGQDILEGGAQIGARMGEAPQIGATQPEMPGGVQRVNQAMRQSAQDYEDNPSVREYPMTAGAGRIAGNVAATAPLALAPGIGGPASLATRGAAGLIGRGLVQGAVGAAMQPVSPDSGDYWGDKAKAIGVGAGVGAALPAVGNAIAPRLPSPDTIGKAFPALRNFISGAEERTVNGFNRTIANQVLDPIGGSVPRNLAGHKLNDAVETQLTQAYDRVLPNLSMSRAGAINAASPETQLFVSELDPLEGQQFAKILENRLFSKIPDNGVIDGTLYKKIESDLSQRAFSFLDTQKKDLGQALLHTLVDLKEKLATENPQWAGELRRVNEGWKMWARMRQAASAGATSAGRFTPGDLLRAIRSQDPTAGKAAFAKGDNVLQGYATLAERAMSSRVSPMELMHLFSRHGLPMEVLRQTGGAAGRGLKAATPYAAGPAGQAAARALPETETEPVDREPRHSVGAQ